MKTALLFLCALSALLSSCETPGGGDAKPAALFSDDIRATDPLSPEEERLALKVPPGFEVQLFASEPDIAKPLNMSFDAKGRLWVTQSFEYPFPDTTGAGPDKISILEDTDGDGRADKFTTFADSLNIPIGIQVVGNGAVAYSIPNIWHFIDHDGDDRVDERKVIYKGFTYDDTHGMVNNLVRSWDGWIHANHGFSNISRVAGSDGDTIVLNSGNTFRFRLDGSRIEFTTTGRTNPFGYAYDELGYTYSTDCHTSPIYQLVRGADYPHLSKEPSGIGFGPALMEHTYGSTALAGLDYYVADQFPEDYRNSFYYGDVVMNRISRSNFQMRGTTPVISQKDDFVISEDPWFRPVDVKLGPDGALYIADFYNRIIGYYEVPLDHPGRDRQRARIWRIVYTGEGVEAPGPKDFSQLSLTELIGILDQPNLALRLILAHHIVDRFGQDAIPVLREALEGELHHDAHVQMLWILNRLEGLDEGLLAEAAGSANDTLQVHALRIVFERSPLSPAMMEAVVDLLDDESPHVRRQAAMVLGQNPGKECVSLLLERLEIENPEDSHLYYSLRQSLRDQLREVPVLDWTCRQSWSREEALHLADLMRGVDEPLAGKFLMAQLATMPTDEPNRLQYIAHSARWLPTSEVDRLAELLSPLCKNDLDSAYSVFLAILEGTEQAGKELGPTGRNWAKALAQKIMEDPLSAYGGWRAAPIDRLPWAGNTWRLVDAPGAASGTAMLASGPAIDDAGGVSEMYSPAFTMPASISFLLDGRCPAPEGGEPGREMENRIELIDAQSGETLKTARITEESTRQKLSWVVNSHTGREVQFKLVHNSPDPEGFIAIGLLDTKGPSLPPQSPMRTVEQQAFAAQLAGKYEIRSLAPALSQLLRSPVADPHVRDEAMRSLLAMNDAKTLASIPDLFSDPVPLHLKENWLFALSETGNPDFYSIITRLLPEISYPAQQEAMRDMVSLPQGIAYVLRASEKGLLNPQLLAEPQVAEKMEAGMTETQAVAYGKLLTEPGNGRQERDVLINERLQAFRASIPDIERGRTVFSVFCKACHQTDGQSGNIGPQLVSIGNWGERALAEKIIAPNRIISKAYQTYTLTLKDGSVRSGLLLGEDGQVLVFANAQGQEFSLRKEDIGEQNPSPFTLMPDHFGQTIPEEDFNELLAFLLSLQAI